MTTSQPRLRPTTMLPARGAQAGAVGGSAAPRASAATSRAPDVDLALVRDVDRLVGHQGAHALDQRCAGRFVERGDEAGRTDAVGDGVRVHALCEVELDLGQLAAGERVTPGAAGVRGRVAAIGRYQRADLRMQLRGLA